MNFSLFRYGPERKALAIVCGMSGAVGEIVVGTAFGIFGRFTVRHGRGSVVLLGCVLPAHLPAAAQGGAAGTDHARPDWLHW
jgi:hypothetical protein